MSKSQNKMARRAFLANGVKLAAAASILTGVNKSQAQEQSLEKSSGKPPKFILDAHIHCRDTESYYGKSIRHRPQDQEIYREKIGGWRL